MEAEPVSPPRTKDFASLWEEALERDDVSEALAAMFGAPDDDEVVDLSFDPPPDAPAAVEVPDTLSLVVDDSEAGSPDRKTITEAFASIDFSELPSSDVGTLHDEVARLRAELDVLRRRVADQERELEALRGAADDPLDHPKLASLRAEIAELRTRRSARLDQLTDEVQHLTKQLTVLARRRDWSGD